MLSLRSVSRPRAIAILAAFAAAFLSGVLFAEADDPWTRTGSVAAGVFGAAVSWALGDLAVWSLRGPYAADAEELAPGVYLVRIFPRGATPWVDPYCAACVACVEDGKATIKGFVRPRDHSFAGMWAALHEVGRRHGVERWGRERRTGANPGWRERSVG